MNYQTVTESIVGRLRKDIVTGEFEAGSKLSEIEISERFGISRQPLREAFRRLENENLVVSIPRKGSFVAQMSVEDCEQINRARMMVECTAIDVIGKKSSVSLREVRRSLETTVAMGIPAPSDDPEIRKSVITWFYALSDFHFRIVKASRNKWLVHCYQGLRSSLARYQVMYLNLPGAKKDSLAEHEKILTLMEHHEYGRARKELNGHLDQARLRLRSSMLGEGIDTEGLAPGAPRTETLAKQGGKT